MEEEDGPPVVMSAEWFYKARINKKDYHFNMNNCNKVYYVVKREIPSANARYPGLVKLYWKDGAPYNNAVPPNVPKFGALTKKLMSTHHLPQVPAKEQPEEGTIEMVKNPNYNKLCNLAGVDEHGVGIDQNIFVTLDIWVIRVSRFEWLPRGAIWPSRVHSMIITRGNFFNNPAKVTPGQVHTGGCYVDEL
jgi:hypothetical protein